jgi:hypothetical protein
MSWKYSKQTCIATSMMGLEFISLDKVKRGSRVTLEFLRGYSILAKTCVDYMCPLRQLFSN